MTRTIYIYILINNTYVTLSFVTLSHASYASYASLHNHNISFTQEQCVNGKFAEQLQELQKKRNLKVIHGMVWQTNRETLGSLDDDEDENQLINEDPLLVLMEFARLSNFSLVDLFNKLDEDKSGSLSRDEFIKGLEVYIYMYKAFFKDGLKLSNYQIRSYRENKHKENVITEREAERKNNITTRTATTKNKIKVKYGRNSYSLSGLPVRLV